MSGSFSIVLRDVQKAYGQRQVLDVGNLELRSADLCALIGANGSGKSTLMRILAGTMQPSSGFIGVEGNRTRGDLRVGYMPQRSYVFDFSVSKNVALALKSVRLTKAEVAARVESALQATGMQDLAAERGGALSGGEAQRVALARLLVQDLDVLLLDEPTASMDIAGTLLVERALEDYRAKTGCLVVMATHAPAQARRLSEKTVVLSQGKVVESGPTEQVLSHPASEEGRAFLSHWAL